MKFIGVIPARYASTRFPGKPLAMLGGKTVIQRVYEQVSAVLDSAYVATDDDRIRQAVEAFGGKAVMTSPNHKSGTDRIEEAVEKIGGDFDVVINVQGDEPLSSDLSWRKLSAASMMLIHRLPRWASLSRRRRGSRPWRIRTVRRLWLTTAAMRSISPVP